MGTNREYGSAKSHCAEHLRRKNCRHRYHWEIKANKVLEEPWLAVNTARAEATGRKDETTSSPPG